MNKVYIFIFLISLTACKVADEEKILGKWQSDDEWYQYFDDKTYNAGRMHLTMVNHFKYVLDSEKGTLTMYTDNPEQTYYLQYRFAGNDTLLLNNALNSKQHFAKFFRVKK